MLIIWNKVSSCFAWQRLRSTKCHQVAVHVNGARHCCRRTLNASLATITSARYHADDETPLTHQCRWLLQLRNAAEACYGSYPHSTSVYSTRSSPKRIDLVLFVDEYRPTKVRLQSAKRRIEN